MPKSKELIDRVEDVLPEPVRGLIHRARRDDVLLFAGALAFYALVSVAPLIIMTLWLVSVFAGEDRVQRVAEMFQNLAPNQLGLDQAMKNVADLGTSLGVTSLIAGLWPASAYGGGLRRAFVRLGPGGDGEDGSSLRGRGLVLLVLLPMFVVGGIVGAYLGTQVFDEGVLRALGWLLALIGGAAVTAVSTIVIYRLFPPDPPSWNAILKGTALVAPAVAVLSLMFAVYMNVGADFEERYATSGLAAVVFLALWLYLSNALLLVGFKAALEADQEER